MKRFISRFIPVSVKKAIELSSYSELRSARRLAATSKRIDICAAQIAHLLHLSSHGPIQDMVCLELGSGWVLSHALVFHLLGAKKVIATDLLPHACPSVITDALRHSVTSLPRDILAPFSDHTLIRERMDNLLSIDKFTFEVLKNIGIEYVSPVDFARQKIEAKIDLIYSNSVLEHVPCKDVPLLIANLCEMLSPCGTMMHAIHLEDHKDISNHPFDFLSVPEDLYTRDKQSARGNRIRCSEWTRLFHNLKGTTTKIIYMYHRRNRPLPREIDASVPYADKEDLSVSHIGMFTRRNQ